MYILSKTKSEAGQYPAIQHHDGLTAPEGFYWWPDYLEQDTFEQYEGFVALGPLLEEKQQLENAAADTSPSLAQSIQNAKNEIARKQSDLEDCRIVSSIDGTVTRVYTKVGRFADEPTEEGRPMFTIENIDDLKMEVDVSEYDIANVALGQNVTVTADILGDGAAQGTITAISPTGEEKAGSTERVIPVEVTIEGGQEGLIAGINAKAEIAVKEAKIALVVPIEAIYDNLGGT